MPYGNIVTSITAPSAELHVSFMVSEKNQDFQIYQYYKRITYKPQVTISAIYFNFLNTRIFKISIRNLQRFQQFLYCREWQEYQKKVKHFFSLFFDNTPPVRIEPVFFKFIEPELATTIISFLKPGVAGGNPCP